MMLELQTSEYAIPVHQSGVFAVPTSALVECNLNVTVPWQEYNLDEPPLRALAALNVMSRGLRRLDDVAREMARRGFTVMPNDVRHDVEAMYDRYEVNSTAKAVDAAIRAHDLPLPTPLPIAGGPYPMNPEVTDMLDRVREGRAIRPPRADELLGTTFLPELVRRAHETKLQPDPPMPLPFPWSQRVVFVPTPAYTPRGLGPRQKIEVVRRAVGSQAAPSTEDRNLRTENTVLERVYHNLGVGTAAAAVTAAIARGVITAVAPTRQKPLNPFSVRVTTHTACGKTSRQIGRELGFHERTISIYQGKACRAVGVETNESAAACARFFALGVFMVGGYVETKPAILSPNQS